MPRAKPAPKGGSGTTPLSSEMVRAVGHIPGTPSSLSSCLQGLAAEIKAGEVSRTLVIQSGLIQQVVCLLESDYKADSSPDLLSSKQRLLKLKLLTQACGALSHDLTDLTAQVLSLVCRVLGFLAVLSGVQEGREGCSLVPTNLPHLHFTQTANNDPDLKRDSCPDTSESDMSDGEMMGQGGDFKRRRLEAMVQKEALYTLGLVAKRVPKKEVVSYWFLFLPDRCYSPLSSSVTSLCTHHNKRVRQQALSIIAEFLNHSGQFLALAQHTEKTTSYTSLSTALAVSLATMHTTLLARLREPLGPTELVAVLKLVALLTEHAPYPRLDSSLLDLVIRSCLDLAREERNPVIQVAVLSVFSSLCQHRTKEASLVNSASALFHSMLIRARPDLSTCSPDNNVRYMAMQALASLATVDIHTFIKQAGDVKKLLDSSLTDSDPSVVLHAFRFIKSFARNLTSLVETESHKGEVEDSKVKNLATSFWVDFLKQSNFALLDKYPNANIKSAFCDCLAEMGGLLYSELPEPKKLLCITYILSQCGEGRVEDGGVVSLERQIQDRAALSSCLRTLGIVVMFPTYVTDTAFHIDVADAILPHLPPTQTQLASQAPQLRPQQPTPAPRYPGLDPSNKAVRVSASWALANLTDTLVQAEKDCEEDFPVTIARNILYTAINAAKDPTSAVNTKSNAVRCVGNMLYYLTRDRVGGEEEFDKVMSAGADCMLNNIKTGKIMKIRWNACYAASNILRKEGLEKNYVWKVELLECLLETVRNFQNFKVRINAAVALGSAVSRGALGDFYIPVLEALVDSLGNTHSEEVFGEWQHQENLRDQLSISLCQVIALCREEKEFSKVCSVVGDSWDLVETSLTHSIKRISPEKSSPFLAASQAAEQLARGNLAGREEVMMLCKLLRELAMDWGG
eukprot:GFUD01129574.1.p1 GENE.GFUD01129574.1~~GFUD01129574.1.p1  ORF type:complete len:911 (-),score=287.76 GFUD01129574.1:124-2856(-)